MIKVGMLAIVIVAFVATMPAVPRYSASVTQVGDSPAMESAESAAQNPSAPVLQRIKQDALSCKDEWSGRLSDLKALVDRAKQKYGFEGSKHMGRNATIIVPANLEEMNRFKSRKDKALGGWWSELGNIHWKALGDGYHAKEATKDDRFKDAVVRTIIGSGVDKYIVVDGEFKGAEVVYDKDTGDIVKDWRMGTRNFSYIVDGVDHDEVDVKTHQNNPEYKYVGILVETDPSDPNKYYIVNGQTGKRMTWREAEDFPSTLSDEWKDMGLACVPDDANDVIEPDECRDEAKCIDTSKLEELLKEGVLFLKDLIAKRERATNSQIDAHNQRVREILAETVSIAKRIDSLNVSAEEKKSIAEKVFERVNGLNSQFNSLCEQAKSMGLVHGASAGKQMEMIKEVQEELSEASRDVERAKVPLSKASATPRGRTMTDEEAIHLLRDDGSGIKAVADAVKE